MKFFDRVYKLCKKIPKGRVSTYKEIAEKLNCRAYRAVGNALNKNKDKNIPCHRIIGSNGYLTGFSKGLNKKAKMLRKEGIEVINNRVDLKKYLFKF